MKTVDAGYFATTPFFISFCDRAVQQRSAYYSYLLALAYRYTGDTKLAQKYIEQAAVSDPYALNILQKDNSERFCKAHLDADSYRFIFRKNLYDSRHYQHFCLVQLM